MHRIMKSGSVIFPYQSQSVSLQQQGATAYAAQNADEFQICVESSERDAPNIDKTANEMWDFLNDETQNTWHNAAVYCVCKLQEARAVIVVTDTCVTVSTCAMDVDQNRRTWKAVMRSNVYNTRDKAIKTKILHAIGNLGRGNAVWDIYPAPRSMANPKETFRARYHGNEAQLFRMIVRGLEFHETAGNGNAVASSLSCQRCGMLIL